MKRDETQTRLRRKTAAFAGRTHRNSSAGRLVKQDGNEPLSWFVLKSLQSESARVRTSEAAARCAVDAHRCERSQAAEAGGDTSAQEVGVEVAVGRRDHE